MSLSSPALRVAVLAAALFGAAAVVGTGGCTSNGATPVASPSPVPTPSPIPSGSPIPSPSPTPTPFYAVSLSYASAAPTTDPSYGPIDGYGLLNAAPQPSASITPAPSQVINVNAGHTITFFNFDGAPHTASLLGPANGQNWPPTFNNANGASASSPAGTAITASQFSTGNLAAGSVAEPTASFQYTTGVPGMYYFGDYYDYLPVNPAAPHMRTVIIVH
jgi:plastocyanin